MKATTTKTTTTKTTKATKPAPVPTPQLDTTLLADIFPAQPTTAKVKKPAKTHTELATEAIGFPPAPAAPAKATKPAPAAEKVHSVVNPPSALSPIAITWRDLPVASRNLFKHIADTAPHWSGTPPTYEVFPSPGSSIKKDEGNLTDLKKRNLVDTFQDAGVDPDITWIKYTEKGEELVKFLEAGGDTPAPVVVDGTKTAPPAKPQVPVKEVVKTKTVTIKTAAQDTVKGKPAPAVKKVPAPKINRAQLRYSAIQEVMAEVKADTWKKALYKPMLKTLPTAYAPLYAKLKTPEKVLAYSTGILDFCLAACRKLDTRP